MQNLKEREERLRITLCRRAVPNKGFLFNHLASKTCFHFLGFFAGCNGMDCNEHEPKSNCSCENKSYCCTTNQTCPHYCPSM